MAFDIKFDDKNAPKRMPKGLQKRKKMPNLTKEELQAKLEAAELRRKVNSFCATYWYYAYHCRLGRKSVKRKYEINLSMTVK